jgi:ATP-dependent protease HslVU (ClpYQ) ATPase subunit
MNKYLSPKTLVRSALLIGTASLIAIPSISFAAASSSTSTSAAPAQRLATIKAKGAAEITRRLTSLNTVTTKISGTTKLSASDQAYLSSEVSAEVSGLTALQTKLASDTTVSEASADAQSIYTEYRVYALVLPKVWLVRTADDQQTTEANLTALAQKLQSRITADQTAGKNITTLQNELNDMTMQTNNAQSISSSMETKVLTLQPSYYNSDHTILSGDLTQLKTAHTDNTAAYTDANSIVSGLKSL